MTDVDKFFYKAVQIVPTAGKYLLPETQWGSFEDIFSKSMNLFVNIVKDKTLSCLYKYNYYVLFSSREQIFYCIHTDILLFAEASKETYLEKIFKKSDKNSLLKQYECWIELIRTCVQDNCRCKETFPTCGRCFPYIIDRLEGLVD